MDLLFTSAQTLATLIREHQVSARDVVDAHLAQIARHNQTLNAIVTLDEAGARQRAKLADEALAKGTIWGPLHGVPIALEDCHATAGIHSTWGGHPSLATHIPSEDSTVTARLKAAGAILLGKTHGPTIWGHESVFDRTQNPLGHKTDTRWVKRRTRSSLSGRFHSVGYWARFDRFNSKSGSLLRGVRHAAH
jgi:amidase